MGPGRLTGMNGGSNDADHDVIERFNGARSIDRDERDGCPAAAQRRRHRFNGARSIDRDERTAYASVLRGAAAELQWGPVD